MDMSESLREIQEWVSINQVGDKVIYIAGIFMILALMVVFLTKRIKVPIVVGYVFLGIMLSFDIINNLPFLTTLQKQWYNFTVENLGYISQLALGFIALTIGSELSIKMLTKLGKTITYIVILQALAAFLIVAVCVYLIGQPLYMALLLGAIATATAPAATVMVLKEYNAEGIVTSMILAVVAIDDALALILFSLIKPVAMMLYNGEWVISLDQIIINPLLEISGSIIIGLLLGYLSQLIIVSVDDKSKKILTLVGTVISGLALSILFHLSPLITNMAVGFAYRNFARRNLGIAAYLETLTIPLYALFFIIAGTEIRFSAMGSSIFLILAMIYFLARIVGKIGGSWLGGVLARAPEKIRKYVGLGLLPQSGVAIALAYAVQKEFVREPAIGMLIFNVLLLTSALTEVVGPLVTKYALVKAGEAREVDYRKVEHYQ